MDELLRALLIAAMPGVAVDWGMTAQGIRPPRVVLYRISGGEDYVTTGRTGYSRSRVQIDCYAVGVGAAKLLGRQVKAALSGYRAGPILGVFIQNERDLSPETDSTDTLGRVSIDIFIHHQEA